MEAGGNPNLMVLLKFHLEAIVVQFYFLQCFWVYLEPHNICLNVVWIEYYSWNFSEFFR